MKKLKPSLRIFYTILVPVVLVVALLNSGLLQRVLPAASAGGLSFTAAAYNFYYFQTVNTAPTPLPEAETHRLAQASLARTVYYSTLAQTAAYSFSSQELAPIEETLNDLRGQATTHGISLKNCIIAYYGTGMTEDVFVQELTRFVRGNAYRTHLLTQGAVTDGEIDTWLASHPETPSYPTAHISLITLKAQPNRLTGEVDATALEHLESRLARLNQRLEIDTFETLAQTFSLQPVWRYESATRERLPQVVADWCLVETPTPTLMAVDRTLGEGYLARYEGKGENAARQTARHTIQQNAIATSEAATTPAVTTHWLGMTVAAR